MRWSQLHIPTLRENQSDAELISHQYLLRGGFIRKLASGIYLYLPLMQRVIAKFSQIVREEMNSAGAQEITMSVLCPAEVWQESGRLDSYGKELMRMTDRHKHDMVLCGTHEESVTYLVRNEVKSYRQLPMNLYQIQVKFRDEIRPRFGLMRGREFIMKDAYTFDATPESFAKSYQGMVDAYFRIFKRAGFEVSKVESDSGAMGGSMAHEFMLLVDTNAGEEVILFSDQADYVANVEKAVFRDVADVEIDTDTKDMETVDTPNAASIEEVASFLKVKPTRLVKTLLYMADDKPVAAMIRGDRDVNEIKLKNSVNAIELEMATAEQVEKYTKAPVGFAGPIGLSKDVQIVVDPLVTKLKNFIVGANKADQHIINVNLERDFKATKIADITLAVAGDGCPVSDGHLVAKEGIEVGNTFSLGTKYSDSMGANFLDAEGKEQPIIMGSYGIGITRTPQAAIEKYHDDKGIIWPKALAPFTVEIVPIKADKESHANTADRLASELEAVGIDVLIDDRDERAGVKFNDADLIGCPIRITIGDKSLNDNKIEMKVRSEKDLELVALDDVVATVQAALEKLP